jgi:peptide/nickel transport system substrate-binding protein
MKKYLVTLLALILIVCLGAGAAFSARSGGSFEWIAPYGSSVNSLDPNMSDDEQNEMVCMSIHMSMYRWDAKMNKPRLELAEKVKVSDDGLVYTYSLRKDVKFHNGRGLKADDVVYTYNRIANPDNAFGAALNLKSVKGAQEVLDKKANTISGIKKIDDYTVEITLIRPIDLAYALFPINMAILPKEAVEDKSKPFGSNPVGLGPFQFVEWVKGSKIVLKKFDGFYKKGLPYLDKLTYNIMNDSAARDNAFRAKELDANLLYSSQYAAMRNDPEYNKNMIEVAEMYTRMIAFNQDYTLADGRKPFSDKRVRQAFNLAINEPLIIEKFQKGKAYPAISFLPPTTPGHDPSLKPYGYDPQKAKELMKAAGYEKGFDLEIVGTGSSSYGTGVVEVIIPFLKKIGINVKPVTLEGAAKYKRQLSGEFQAIIGSLNSGPDPVQALWRFHGSNDRSTRNTPNFKNKDFDAALEAAAAARGDEAKKLEYVKKANKIFLDEAPIWFFNYNKAIIAYHPWVHGMQAVGPEMMFQDFTEVWVDDKSPRANAK